MIHPDFPNGHFVLGSRFQNRARQANMIIEITFRLSDAKFPRENRRDEIFRARLAVASRDGEHL